MSVAIITGASGGIGRELTKGLYLDYGVRDFWLVGRNERKLDAILSELRGLSEERGYPLNVKQIIADLGCEDGISKVKEALESEKPCVSHLINAAGFGKFGRFDEVSLEDAASMIDVNSKATVLLTYMTVPYMERGGRIIQLGSGSCFTPLPNFNVYASSKIFVLHHTKALNYELKRYEIRATCFCPGWVETEFFDTAIENGVSMPEPKKIKPMLNAKKVARGCLKASKRGKTMYVTGWYTKLQHLLFKLVPDPILTRVWLGMQKKDKK